MSLGNPLTTLSLSQLRERTSVKWRLYEPDVLPLWVAEMDVELAEPIRLALETAIARGDTGYPGQSAQYVEAFVDFARSRFGWSSLEAAHVQPVVDVITGYTDILLQLTGGAGTVVVTSPVYPPFYSYLRQAGLTVIEARLGEDMRLDFAELERVFAGIEGPRALLLCNPHNPGGTLHTREELTTLAALAREHHVAVVSDEIHAPLTYAGGEFVPYLSVPGGEHGFALHSASKAFNLAAMPAALLVGGTETADALKEFRSGAHHGPSHLGVIAQTAGYREGGEWLDALLAGLDQNRRLAADLFAEHVPGAVYRMPEATYLAWVDCRGLGLDGEPAKVFAEKARVAFNPGPLFGTGGAGHIRVNLATHPEILAEAVRRVASIL